MTSVEKKKVCLSSFASPWFFGPYGAQLYNLISKMVENDSIEIYYLLLANGLDDRIYSFDEMYAINFENENKEKKPEYINTEILKQIQYIGGVVKNPAHGTILSSSLNNLLEKHNIDVYLFLSDTNNIIADKAFSCRSLIWYPNHFNPITKYIANILPIFSDIVALCPSDYELVKTTIPYRSAHFIPHSIMVDEKVMNWKEKKLELRKKHNVPESSFIVLINCGNYEILNRKGIDSALMAFEEFQKKHDDVFLFIHAWKLQNLQNSYHKSSNMFLNPSEVLELLSIPPTKYHLHEEIVEYNTILEYIAMSDVLLQGSRTEGFCVPILESQMLQTPVITTAFGAMKDYTYYGYSVPYVQREYVPMAKGMWVVPSITGMTDALEKVYLKQDNMGDALVAQKKVRDMTNIDHVYDQFLKIINETPKKGDEMGIMNEEIICTRVHYNPSTNKLDLYKNFDLRSYASIDRLESTDLKGKWTCFFHDNVPVDPMFFLFQAKHHDLIFLKTRSKNGDIYPTLEMVSSDEMLLHLSTFNFAVNTNFVKYIFTSELNNVYNSHVIHYILTHCIHHSKIALSDPVICTI